MTFNSRRLLGGLLLAIISVAALPRAAMAQTSTVCGPEIKLQFAQKMDELEKQFGPDKADQETGIPQPSNAKLAAETELYKQFAFCGLNQPASATAFFNSVRQCAAANVPGQSGSSFYEEMSCCGYDPQKRQFACPVRVKQNFGFGASPFPGSREYVLNCVFSPAAGAFVPVALDSVHLSNSTAQPSWMFGVIATVAGNFGTVLPLNQATERARSILSWNAVPRGCNYRPIWGNTLEYRIRRDQ
jgi:hypothetical protein